jgi:hypothetical protein
MGGTLMRAKSIFTENLTTAALTDSTALLYTVPPNTKAKWVLAFISNGSGSTISNVHLEISNGVDIVVLGSKSLGSGDFIQLKQDGGYVMLEAGYEIRGNAGSTGVSCILTVEETSSTVTYNG